MVPFRLVERLRGEPGVATVLTAYGPSGAGGVATRAGGATTRW